jgi:HlyD family type I secretion membrane fusion protein
MKRKWFLLNFGFLIAMLLVLVSLGVWFWYGNLEESVAGIGQLVPEGKLRRVMSPVSGKVTRLLVEENQQVKAGQVLMVIDPEVITVEQNALIQELDILQSESQALQAAYEGRGAANASHIHNAWLDATRKAVGTEMQQARMQIQKSQHLYQEALNKQKHLRKLLASQEELLAQTRGLSEDGGLSLKDLQIYEQQVIHTRSELAELEENIEARRIELEQAKEKPENLTASYQRDMLDRLSQHQQKVAVLGGQVAKTQVLMKQEVIRAPIDGIVNEQVIHGAGEVIQAGNVLLSLVPVEAPLDAEVRVSNRDLSYIRIGQQAALRLDALPYQQFGRLHGRITAISPSSIIDKEGQPFFMIRIKPEKRAMTKDGKKFPLQSGMTVSADIITREKNILSFFTEPFHYHIDKAFRDPSNR